MVIQMMNVTVCVDQGVSAGLGLAETAVCIRDVKITIPAVVNTGFGAGLAGQFGISPVRVTLAERGAHPYATGRCRNLY